MEVNREVQGRHGRPLSQQILQVRAIQQQRELRLNATYRNFHQRSFDQGHSRQCSDILPHKADIFMKAGRLAAEYLVSKGLLSQSLLPRNQTNADQEKFNWKEGDFLEPRTSTPDQTGKASRKVDQSDENDSDPIWTWHLTSRKRREPDSRGSGLVQRGDTGRRGQSVERTPRKPDTEDGDEDFPPGFGRSWHRGLAEAGENATRIFKDDQFTRGNGKGEHRSEIGNYRTKDDATLKAGSGRTGKDHPKEANLNLNKVGDSGSSVAVDTVKGNMSSASEKKDKEANLNLNKVGDNGSSVVVDTVKGNMSNASEKKDVRMDDHQERKHEHSLLKLISFAEVPKKPRLLLARRNKKFSQVDQGPIAEAKTTSKAARDNGSSVLVVTRKGKVSSASEKIDVRMDDHQEGKHEQSLLKLISFAEVPKKPRSSLARRNQKFAQVDQEPIAEAKTTSKATLKGVSMFVHHDRKTDERCSRCDRISGPRPEKANCGTTDDTKTKASYSRTWKAHQSEPNLDVGKLDDDGKVLDLLRTDSSGHSKKQDVLLEDKTSMQHDNDLLKQISFPQVQKKPRSLLAKRNRRIDLVDQGHAEAKRTLKVHSRDAHKVATEEDSSLDDIKSLVCMIDNAILPIKKIDKANLIQSNDKMDEQHQGSDYVTADDNRIKVNSFRKRKGRLSKATMEFNDAVDDGRVTSSLKIYSSGDLDIRKDADQLIWMGDIDLLKLNSVKVIRKPRTISRKKPKF